MYVYTLLQCVIFRGSGGKLHLVCRSVHHLSSSHQIYMYRKCMIKMTRTEIEKKPGERLRAVFLFGRTDKTDNNTINMY